MDIQGPVVVTYVYQLVEGEVSGLVFFVTPLCPCLLSPPLVLPSCLLSLHMLALFLLHSPHHSQPANVLHL